MGQGEVKVEIKTRKFKIPLPIKKRLPTKCTEIVQNEATKKSQKKRSLETKKFSDEKRAKILADEEVKNIVWAGSQFSKFVRTVVLVSVPPKKLQNEQSKK